MFEPPDYDLPAATVPFDPVGGMQTHTGALTRAVDRAGHRQVVVTTRPPGTAARSRFGDRTTVLRLGLPVPYCRQFYAAPAAAAVFRLAAGADLIHAHLGEDLAVVPIALAAARRHRRPLVLTVHTSVAHTLAPTGVRSLLLKTVGGRLERYGERSADAVIVLTQQMAQRLTAGGVARDRIHVIPSGIDPTLFRACPDGAAAASGRRASRTIVYVGRLHRQKGVETLLRAFALLRTRAGGELTELVLAGDGPQRSELERLAAGLGIASRTRFLGFVPHARVPALLHSAAVAVLPSRYEELGTSLLEALACGTPVVASAVGGIPDLIRDGVDGLLVPPQNPELLAAAVRTILDDPALAARLSAAGCHRAARYGWPALQDKVLAVYEKLRAG